MERRTVGEVHESGCSHHRRQLRIFRLGPVEDRKDPDRGTEVAEVGLGAVTDSFGVLERGRRREDQHLAGTARRQQFRVEFAPPRTPFAATDEGKDPGGTAWSHDRGAYCRLVSRPGDAVRSYQPVTSWRMSIKRIGVVGSGIMGSGVAEVAAKSGFEVVLRSRSQSSADAMLAALDASLARQVKKGRLEESAAGDVRGRVTAVTAIDELAACELVLESIVEDLALKQELFRELDRVCAPGALLATNTSTLPIVDMAMVTSRPERVCGIHFFNPAPAMSLVEVVPAITTSDVTLEEARAFVVACGKTAVTVKDQAGFVVNALLFPYLNNAVRLFDAGVASRDDIDAAMKGGCNFPMGPLELLDLVGLDTSLAILDALYAEFRDPNFAPAPLLRRMVAAEHLGRKSGAGFYDYVR